MATAKWATPSAQGSNIASTTLDSLANGSTSTVITYDNSSNLDYYAAVEILLGSFTSTTGAAIVLRAYAVAGAGGAPDTTGGAIGGDTYPVPITVGASAKVIVIPMIRLYPYSMRLQVTNLSGAAFASSGNSIRLTPGNESVT